MPELIKNTSTDKTASPFRVLYVVPFSDIGGSEQVILDHLRYLDRSKYEPLLVSLRPGDIVDAARRMGVKSFALRPHKTREIHRVLQSIRQLSSIIKSERIDLVFASQGSMLLYCGLAAASLKCPVVWTFHDPLTGESSFERAFVAVQKRIQPAWAISSSPGTLESYRAAYPNIRERSSVIFPGTDPELLAKGADGARARQTLGIPNGVPILSQFARLQSSKGHPYLVAAAVTVLKRYPEARFVIAGDTLFGIEPEYKPNLLQSIEAAGIGNRVLMTGYISDADKRDLLAASDIVVHPAVWEPFGISVIEGMGVGKPVVAAASSGPKLSVVDGKTGFLVPVENSEALAEAILKLLDDPAMAARMGEAGRRHVMENYTAEQMVRQAETIFESLLRR